MQHGDTESTEQVSLEHALAQVRALAEAAGRLSCADGLPCRVKTQLKKMASTTPEIMECGRWVELVELVEAKNRKIAALTGENQALQAQVQKLQSDAIFPAQRPVF